MDHKLSKKSHTLPIDFVERLKAKPSKICFQRADRLGDMVLCLPAVHAIKQAFPLAELHVICSPKNNQLITLLDIFNHSFCIDIDYATRAEKKRFSHELIEQQYDILINFWAHPFFETMARKLNGTQTIGPKTSFLSNLNYNYAIRLEWSNMFNHEIDFNLSLLNPFKLTLKKECSISPSLPSFKQTTQTILIFCSSGGSNLTLSDEMILSLIQHIQEKTTYHIVLTYGLVDDDSPLLKITGPRVKNICTPLNLADLTQQIMAADIYIGPDTGPTHIASFLNKKCFVVFRSKHNPPVRWGPQSDFFTCIRREYSTAIVEKEKKEIHDIMTPLLSNTPLQKYTDKQKRLLHLKASFRLCLEVRTKREYQRMHQSLLELKKDGWIIFVHFTRPNFISQWVSYQRKIDRRNLNVFLTSQKKWWHYMIDYQFYTRCKPKPLFTNIHSFKPFINQQLEQLSSNC